MAVLWSVSPFSLLRNSHGHEADQCDWLEEYGKGYLGFSTSTFGENVHIYIIIQIIMHVQYIAVTSPFSVFHL